MAVNYPVNVTSNRTNRDDIVYSAPKLPYHLNRPFHRETRNGVLEKDNIAGYRKNDDGSYKLDKKGNKMPLYGFKDGTTYIWEVQEALEEIYQKGALSQNRGMRGRCEDEEYTTDKSTEGMPPWMVIAWQEYNTYKDYLEKESPLKERISEYFSLVGLPDHDHTQPWCGAFVNWCFDHTQEYKKTNSKGAAGARDWEPKDNPYLKGTGKDGWPNGEECEPFYGAVVVVKPFAHVAFLVGYNSSTNQFIYLGGNQGGGDVRPGYQKIRLGSMSKSKFLYIMKPKGYVITEENKKLPESMETAVDSAQSTR